MVLTVQSVQVTQRRSRDDVIFVVTVNICVLGEWSGIWGILLGVVVIVENVGTPSYETRTEPRVLLFLWLQW
jgi:hypothetical protein